MPTQEKFSRGWFFLVDDKKLQDTILRAMFFIVSLAPESRKEDQSEVYKLEVRRVIVLYICSIIEVILLSRYKKHKTKITIDEYKHVEQLKTGYVHKSNVRCPVVVAVRTTREKSEHQIGLSDLVKFFNEDNYLDSDMADKINVINNVRNTFHLGKNRDGITLDNKFLEDSFGVLFHFLYESSQRRRRPNK